MHKFIKKTQQTKNKPLITVSSTNCAPLCIQFKGMIAKVFYQLPCSKALRTLSLSMLLTWIRKW